MKIFVFFRSQLFLIFSFLIGFSMEIEISIFFENFRSQKFSSMDFIFDLKIFRINLFGRSFFLKIIIFFVRIEWRYSQGPVLQPEGIKREMSCWVMIRIYMYTSAHGAAHGIGIDIPGSMSL